MIAIAKRTTIKGVTNLCHAGLMGEGVRSTTFGAGAGEGAAAATGDVAMLVKALLYASFLFAYSCRSLPMSASRKKVFLNYHRRLLSSYHVRVIRSQGKRNLDRRNRRSLDARFQALTSPFSKCRFLWPGRSGAGIRDQLLASDEHLSWQISERGSDGVDQSENRRFICGRVFSLFFGLGMKIAPACGNERCSSDGTRGRQR